MSDKQILATEETALRGRATPLQVDDVHFVNHSQLSAEPKEGQQKILIGMGCFWGVERLFWQLDGVISTSVGYSGGYTPNPTYEEVCTGKTGHAEVVRVIFDPAIISLEELLSQFWERHDPTQGMRQGNDEGTQYRSVIYYYKPQQKAVIEKTQHTYQQNLKAQGFGPITTEIQSAGPFYFAESYHQQYLAKNPEGYCGLGGTGVCFLSQD